MKKFDSHLYNDKKVLVIQDLSQTNGFDEDHPLMKLSSVGAHVYVAMRENSSSRGMYENSPLIKGVLVSNGLSNIRGLLSAIRAEKFDAIFLFLPSKIIEKYIPYVGLFLLIPHARKTVLIQENSEIYAVPSLRFGTYVLQSMIPYLDLIVCMPIIYAHNRFRKQRHIHPYAVKKILLIRLDHIGDTILASPLLDTLKSEFPNATIDVLMGPWSVGLYMHDDRITHIHTFNAPWYARGTFEKDFSYKKFQKAFHTLKHTLKKNQYDLAIDPRGDSFNSWIAYNTGATFVAGSAGAFFNMAILSNKFLLTHISEYGRDIPHASEQQLHLMETILQKKLPISPPTLHWNEDDELAAKKILSIAQHSVKIGIHATSGKKITQWPKEFFLETIIELSTRFGSQLSFFLFGSSAEFCINEELKNTLFERNIFVENIAGIFSLPELAAFFSKLDLVIANDSGPAHIAAATHTNLIALYLPSIAKVFAPKGDTTRILLAKESEGIASIPVSEVVHAATEIIKNI